MLFTIILVFFLLDTSSLTCASAEIKYPCPAYLTMLVYLDGINKRGCYREYSFNTNIARHFPDSEGLRICCASNLYYNTTVLLDSLLATFLNLIVNCYGVAGLKLRELPVNSKLLFYNIH